MGTVTKIFGWLFGGPTSTTEKVLEVADKALDTAQERSERDAQDLEGARQFAGISNQPGAINQLVDATNRLIRPWVTIELFMRWFGYRPFPDIQGIDPFWVTITMLVLTFWFGGRAIMKDIPQAIQAIRLLRGK